MGQLFDELKRRNVFRVTVAYIVSAWLILQVVDVVLNNIAAPDWVFSVFLLGLGLGLPLVVLFSWAYEITPEGIKRESDVDRSTSITPHTGRKLDQVTLIMLVCVVLFVFVERAYFSETQEEAPAATPLEEVVETVVEDKSIAVLAFEDLSPSGDQAFFAEGLSEELLNVLAQVPDLKVAGRTSSFAFKGKHVDLREIGEVLNVAHILEGSVRKSGNRIRVTAQLIKADDGFHLFSKTYDRDLDDVFAVQDELAAEISTALKSELIGTTTAQSAAPNSVETFNLYILARQRIRTRDPILMAEAVDLIDEALELDPVFAPLYAQRALAIHLLSDDNYGDIPLAVAQAEATALVERALELDPDLAEAHAVLGLTKVVNGNSGDNSEAITILKHALELNPNMESAKLWLANAVTNTNESIALYEEAAEHDPLYAPVFENLVINYSLKSRFDQAGQLIDRVEGVKGEDESVGMAKGIMALYRGDLSESVRGLRISTVANPNDMVARTWYTFPVIQIGEFQEAIDDGDEIVRLIAYWNAGQIDLADQMIRDMDFSTGRVGFKLRMAGQYLTGNGRSDELLGIVEKYFGGALGLLESLPVNAGFGPDYLPPVAFAYLREGRQEELSVVLDYFEDVMNDRHSEGVDNWALSLSHAELAVLKGDTELAFEYIQRALDQGVASVPLQQDIFLLLSDDDRFDAIVKEMAIRADRERAEMGLSPFGQEKRQAGPPI